MSHQNPCAYLGFGGVQKIRNSQSFLSSLCPLPWACMTSPCPSFTDDFTRVLALVPQFFLGPSCGRPYGPSWAVE